jgi:hypothetical protein
VLSGSVRVLSCASLPVVKCINSVLAKSNCIALSAASLYKTLTSLSSSFVFFFRLVDAVVIEMSSI